MEEAVPRGRDTILQGQEHGLPWPPEVATIPHYFALGSVLVMVLAKLTVIILKQYLVTENISVLLKAVLNLDTLIIAHK